MTTPLIRQAQRLQQRHSTTPIGGYRTIAPELLALAREARRTLKFRELLTIHQIIREVRRTRDKAIAQRTASALKLKARPQGEQFDDLTRWYICASGQFELLPESPLEIARLRGIWQGTARAVGINIPQTGPAWEPPTTPEGRTVLHQPTEGSAPYLLAFSRKRARPSRRLPGRLNDEFEHYVVIGAPNWRAAQREYWRHVANRACLALLADRRLPAIPPRPSSPSSSPPSGPPRIPVGSNVFLVEVESVQLSVRGQKFQTNPLALELLVDADTLPTASRKTLETLRNWPAPKTVDPLFKYRADRAGFKRRDGLSGDVITLFEVLLRPHAHSILTAMPPEATGEPRSA